MISYIYPEISFKALLEDFCFRRERAAETLIKLKDLGARCVYVREKQRYCLSSFLMDIGLKNENILIPAYTCSSLAEAIKKSGNNPLFYDVTKDFKVDLSSLKREAEKGIKAIILSDVFGLKMDVEPFLKTIPEKPLVIADYAHHESIDFNSDKRSYIDVVMYSSAYYKPISSTGIGLLFTVSERLDLEDSICLNDSSVKSLVSVFKLILAYFLLNSFLFKHVYRFLANSDCDEFKQSMPAPIISLAQLNRFFFTPKKELRFFVNETYRNKMKGLYSIQATNLRKTYYSIVVEEARKESIHALCLKKGLFLGCVFGKIAGERMGHCPNALYYSKRILNIPFIRRISHDEQNKIISTIVSAVHNV